MDSFFIKVDSSFLNTLDPQRRTIFEGMIQNKSDYVSYIRMCPYCNNFYILSVSAKKVASLGNPKFCSHCGEPSPFNKIAYSIKKAHILYELSISNKPLDENLKNKTKNCAVCNLRRKDILPNKEELKKAEIERVLLEQCIVNFATGIELFLKEIFIIGMDLKFVKSELSLFSKFYKDSKNEFLNMGKLNFRFKDELGIDLKTLFGDDIFKELNIILLKRNAIVHNNGLADKTFIAQTGLKISSGSIIPITDEEMKRCFLLIESVVEKIKESFDQLFLTELMKKIDINIQKLQP